MGYVSATCLILFLASTSRAMCVVLICFIIVAFPNFLAWGYLLDIIYPCYIELLALSQYILGDSSHIPYLCYHKFLEYSSPSNSIT